MIKTRPSKQEMIDFFEYLLEMNDHIGEQLDNSETMNEDELQAAADIVAAHVESGFCNTLSPITHAHLHFTYEHLKRAGYIKEN